MNSRVGVVQRVGPVAVRREREAAIAASGLRLRREGGFLIIDVGDGELARRGELGVFGDRTGIRAADDGAIVAAADSDNQLLGGGCACTVGHADRNGQCLSQALSQMLVGRVNWLEAVAAIGVERKAIDRIGETEGKCVTSIHIGSNHLAREQRAIFGYRLALRGEYWHIVRADDIDGNRVSGAVGAMYGEAVVQELAFAKPLDLSLAVVDAVAPIGLAVGLRGQGKAAVAAQARALLGREEAFAAVHIAHAEVAFDGGVLVFLELAGRAVVSDGGAVVGAGERNRQVLSAAGPGAVSHGDRDGQRLGPAGGQVLVGRVGRVEAVAAVGVQGEAGHRLVDVEAQGVARIRVAGLHLAAEQGAVFTHRLGLREQHRGVVLAVDRHRNHMAGAIGTGHQEAVGQLGAGLQVLHRRLAVVHAVDPVAAGIDAEAAIGAGHLLLRVEVALAGIGVADAELAAGLQLAGVIDADVGDRDGQRVADIGHGSRCAQGGGQAVDGHTAQGVVVHVVAHIAGVVQLPLVTAVVQVEGTGAAHRPVQHQPRTRMALQQVHHLTEADVVAEHALVAATGQYMAIRIHHVGVAAVEAENHVAQTARILGVDRVADLFEQEHVALERADDAGQKVVLDLVGALDAQAQGVGRTVDAVHGEALGGALSRAQGLHGGAVVVGFVDPMAIRTQREMAELAGQV